MIREFGQRSSLITGRNMSYESRPHSVKIDSEYFIAPQILNLMENKTQPECGRLQKPRLHGGCPKSKGGQLEAPSKKVVLGINITKLQGFQSFQYHIPSNSVTAICTVIPARIRCISQSAPSFLA